ncbi:hypothetical protein DSUL_60296 [Desulfovibrionales bacterium]
MYIIEKYLVSLRSTWTKRKNLFKITSLALIWTDLNQKDKF